MAKTITKDEVIEKLKDDGDFDRIRIQIIRRLKENEELRNSMISVVKESTALNRPGAQTMKPRQLSDSIFEEVGSQMMNQLSDNLWAIIKSENGVKNEIRETVQAVYNKILNPGGVEEREEKTGPSNQDSHRNETRVKPGAATGAISNNEAEPQEPPGFSLPGNNQSDKEEQEVSRVKGCNSNSKVDVVEKKSMINEEDSDEDPDVPPGFG